MPIPPEVAEWIRILDQTTAAEAAYKAKAEAAAAASDAVRAGRGRLHAQRVKLAPFAGQRFYLGESPPGTHRLLVIDKQGDYVTVQEILAQDGRPAAGPPP